MMLTREASFGTATSADVARVIGLSQIPYGVALLVMQTFGYLQLSARGVSDATCLSGAGACTAVSTALFSLATRPWHIYALYTLNGFGIGLTFGAYINVPNAYIARFYPHAIAQARSVPFPFFNLGHLLGPILLPLLGPTAHRTGWLCAGGFHALAICLILVVVKRIADSLAAADRAAVAASQESGDFKKTKLKRMSSAIWQAGLAKLRGPLSLLELQVKDQANEERQNTRADTRARYMPVLEI